MPRVPSSGNLDDFRLQVGGPAPPPPPGRPETATGGTVYDVQWPATVVRQEGQWLWVEDNSGYSVPAVSGWVSTEEVLHLDEPTKPGDPTTLHDCYTYYSEQLRTRDEPSLHWLLGIYLESKDQKKAARKEYEKALEGAGYLFDPVNIVNMLPHTTPQEKSARKAMALLFDAKALQDAAKAATKYDTWGQESKEKLTDELYQLQVAEEEDAYQGRIAAILFRTSLDEPTENIREDLRKLWTGMANDAAPLFAGPTPGNLACTTAIGSPILPCQLDAKIRLERLRAKESKSSVDAERSAVQLVAVIALGEKRPYAYYEVGEALKKAYQNKSLEDQKAINDDGDALDNLADHKKDLRRDLNSLERDLEGLEGLLLPPPGAPMDQDLPENVRKALGRARRALDKVGGDLGKIENDITWQAVIGPDRDPANQPLPVDGDDLNKVAADFGAVLPAPPVLNFTALGRDLEAELSWLSWLQGWVEAAESWDSAMETEAEIEKTLSRIELGLDIVWGSRLLTRARIERNLGEFWTAHDRDLLGSDEEQKVIDEEHLLRRADEFYKLAVSREANGVCVGGDPHWFKGYFGRAGLRRDRLTDLASDSDALQQELQDLRDEVDGVRDGVGGLRVGRTGAGDRGAGRAGGRSGRSSEERYEVVRTQRSVQAPRKWLPNRQAIGPIPAPDKALVESASALAGQVSDEAGELSKVRGPLYSAAVRLFSDAIRCNTGYVDAYRDRGAMYRGLAEVAPGPGTAAARADLEEAATDLRAGYKQQATAAAAKQRLADAVTQVTAQSIKNRWGANPWHLLGGISGFQEAALAGSEEGEDDTEQEIKDSASRLCGLQATLSGDENLTHAREDAQKACDLGDSRNVDSLVTLARVYAALGDFQNAEYHQNRAAYYALLDPTQGHRGDLPSLIGTREDYREQIAPDHFNVPWRDASIALKPSLPPTVSGKGSSGSGSTSN
ncbi:MAG: hypothetical protein ABSG86_10705 [Thermoguttaceae bacterium]